MEEGKRIMTSEMTNSLYSWSRVSMKDYCYKQLAEDILTKMVECKEKCLKIHIFFIFCS